MGTIVKSNKDNTIGKVTLQDFRQEGDVREGNFFAANKIRLVDATLKESGKDIFEMKVKACFRSKTISLTSIE